MTIINGIEIDDTKYNENDIKKAILNNDPIEDKLHVIVVLENTCKYAVRYILCKEFIRRMKDEKDIILYIVELAYGSQDYYITESDNEHHLRLRSNDATLWHKENLINIGVKKLLPSNWKSVAWLDADIEFESSTWVMDTLKILNGCKDIVQLFSHCVFMNEYGDTDHLLTGFGFQHVKKTKRSTRFKDVNHFWHPGFAWACSRRFYEKIGGLYEYAITGDGDMLMASCFISNYASALPRDISEGYKNSLKDFESRTLNCRLGYVPGVIRHFFHGNINSRKYDLREQILTKHNYNPITHLTKNKNGLLIPSKDCPKELLTSILSHFQSKKEDKFLLSKINIRDDESEVVSINLKKIMEYHFQTNSINCILLNLKKDTQRFESTKLELEKISIPIEKTIYFEATFWKNLNQLETDLNYLLNFLKSFNNEIPLDKVNINYFAEPNDPLIQIQSGALACYCSHVKAMIHGYEKFENYTIICEDDISIQHLGNIEKNIPLIPSNWDIICFGSQRADKNTMKGYSFYKFTGLFYHLHFYIIKNSCFETIFQNLYPITDQIDVLIGRLYDKLNIYNIPNTIQQKDFHTNIQNNLHLIYNMPVYSRVVTDIEDLTKLIQEVVDNKLPENNTFNKSISDKIMENVIYNNIFNNIEEKVNNSYEYLEISSIYDSIYNQINKILYNFISYDNVNNFIQHLIHEIDFIVSSFEFHNQIKEGIVIKAYNFGSTSSVYKLGDDIIKVYNKRLRWSCETHNNIETIFEREIQILTQLGDIKYYVDDKKLIRMKYEGESLYNKFNLPSDYKEQITEIFNVLNSKDIWYPEFNINNILVNDDGKISFVDYGLAEINGVTNNENCKNFLELLEILKHRFEKTENVKERQILYSTFINTLKNEKQYTLNIF